MPPNVHAGCLRKVGWKSLLATSASRISRANSGPAPSGGSNSCRPPTCIGCSRDSIDKNTESSGLISSMASLKPRQDPGPADSAICSAGEYSAERSDESENRLEQILLDACEFQQVLDVRA